jgi:hypothetical protein
MSANAPSNSVERSNAAERGDRPDARRGSLDEDRPTRAGRVFTTLVGAGVLLASLGSAAFAVGAVLELGALVQDVMALVTPDPAVMPSHGALAPIPEQTAPPAARDSITTIADAAVPPQSASLALNVATAPARPDIEDALIRQEAPSASLDDRAEASEKVVPLSVAPSPPLARTECPEVFVYIVSVVEPDVRLSVASLGIGNDGPARLRHLGDRIGDWQVAAITDDWSGLRPEVWLVRGETYCRARLAGNPSRIHSAARPSLAPRAKRARKATPPPETAAPPVETARPPIDTAAPPVDTATLPTETAVGPAKKAKKSKARRRRRRRRR